MKNNGLIWKYVEPNCSKLPIPSTLRYQQNSRKFVFPTCSHKRPSPLRSNWAVQRKGLARHNESNFIVINISPLRLAAYFPQRIACQFAESQMSSSQLAIERASLSSLPLLPNYTLRIIFKGEIARGQQHSEQMISIPTAHSSGNYWNCEWSLLNPPVIYDRARVYIFPSSLTPLPIFQLPVCLCCSLSTIRPYYTTHNPTHSFEATNYLRWRDRKTFLSAELMLSTAQTS